MVLGEIPIRELINKDTLVFTMKLCWRKSQQRKLLVPVRGILRVQIGTFQDPELVLVTYA